MLSIIICSRTKSISVELSENIKNTIGCAYELVVIDNSENRYSIFEAYNRGIEKSKGVFLCFIHDDVLFHTQNWGVKIKEIFQSDPKIGLIGVAGAKVKTKMPSAWWDCDEEFKVINIIQHYPKQPKEHCNLGFTNNLLEEVVVIDGVFMAWRKDKQIKFNENLKGFHNYDLNLAFECKRYNYKIVVTNQVLLEHFSIGTINKDWVTSTFNFYKLYKKQLPLSVNTFSCIKRQEVLNSKRFINESMRFNLKINALVIWVQLMFLNPISKFHFKFLKRILKESIKRT